MASSNTFYTSSPTVVLPANNPHHYFMNSHYADANPNTSNGIATSDVVAANRSIPPTPGSVAGRKRGRGDDDAPEDDEQAGNPMLEDHADAMMAESSADAPLHLAHTKRPSFSSRKSQRTEGAAVGGDNNLAQLVLPPQMKDVTEEPLIEEATRVLGISWVRMDSKDSLRISQAAYTKWIQKHYSSLRDVSVWFENTAIPGYLVEAHSVYNGERAYYIFSNDLTEARMVTTEPGQLLPRLQMLPALHLAAPGGCLHAETDPITAAQNEIDGVQVAMSDGDIDPGMLRGRMQDYVYPRGKSVEPYESGGLCAAHAMELD